MFFLFRLVEVVGILGKSQQHCGKTCHGGCEPIAGFSVSYAGNVKEGGGKGGKMLWYFQG